MILNLSTISGNVDVLHSLRSAVRDTNSSLPGLVDASLKAASLHLPLSAMFLTYSPTPRLIITSLKTALFPCCIMSDTNSSLSSIIGTSIVAASLYLVDIRLRFLGNRLLRQFQLPLLM